MRFTPTCLRGKSVDFGLVWPDCSWSVRLLVSTTQKKQTNCCEVENVSNIWMARLCSGWEHGWLISHPVYNSLIIHDLWYKPNPSLSPSQFGWSDSSQRLGETADWRRKVSHNLVGSVCHSDAAYMKCNVNLSAADSVDLQIVLITTETKDICNIKYVWSN